MTRNRLWALLVLAVAVAGGLAVAAVLGHGSPAPSPSANQAAAVLARIDGSHPTSAAPSTSAVPGATALQGTPGAAEGAPAGPAKSGGGTGGSAGPVGAFDGDWVLRSDAPNSVGYRIDEIVAGTGVNTAVSKTSALRAELRVAGNRLNAAQVVADLTKLSSNQALRDRTLRQSGLETERYPAATFTLTTPVELGKLDTSGTVVRLDATGALTLHGVTRSVTVPFEVKSNGATVALTATFPVRLADFAITKPDMASVLTIEDVGNVELELYLSRA